MVSKLTNKLGGPFGGRDAICQASVAFDSATSNGSSILIAHLKWGSGLVRWPMWSRFNSSPMSYACAEVNFLLILPLSFNISSSIRIKNHLHETQLGLMRFPL